MSTPPTTLHELTRPRLSTPAPNWLREPLLHFLLLGCVLFAIDHFIAGGADDPRVILVAPAVDDQARQLFKQSRGRDANADELYAMRRIWLDNEVLYREGLAMQVDKGDSAIRERVIFKALSVVDANVKLPPYDDKLLRNWFEGHRVKYDEPARYDFQEAVLDGDPSETAAREFADALNKGAPGDAKAGLRVFKGRPRANLVESYGPQFTVALEESPPGQWRALRTRDAWHVMRLDSIVAPSPAVYEALRGVVLQDWTDATLAEQRSAAVRALAKKYVVRYEAAAK